MNAKLRESHTLASCNPLHTLYGVSKVHISSSQQERTILNALLGEQITSDDDVEYHASTQFVIYVSTLSFRPC